jgi:hypothetical protein
MKFQRTKIEVNESSDEQQSKVVKFRIQEKRLISSLLLFFFFFPLCSSSSSFTPNKVVFLFLRLWSGWVEV